MTLAGSLLLSHEWGVYGNNGYNSQHKRQEAWSHSVFNGVHRAKSSQSSRCNVFQCRSFLVPGGGNGIPVLKTAAAALTKSYNSLYGSPGVLKLVPAVGIIAFAAWGLGPLMRLIRVLFLRESDNSWKKSSTHYVMTSYLQPLLLWTGAMLICRVLDPIILPTEASQAIKQRLLNFIQSLSTVLAFAYCLSSLIQQVQKFFMETNEPNDARNMGFQFAGKAVYTAVWVAAVSLFMELLGFSTQKWVTAGGLGTVLLTLAGREIFTNFLSSVMIHATRPFITNEWIQTKIEGYEVSGTVEHVGWWSPTIIRGDDREAIHIPNHKFTMNVVRNLSQKTHWRIKTYLAISHLDANKINNIVADMRKVLGKHPQVEQQRLHRRVFLENIDPENQALMILVSCFVKTSGFEEYLRVKEAILLDLLRVISHHRARLATPIRTVQKIYDDDNLPFADTIFRGSRPASNRNRPLLLPSTPNAASVAPVEDTDDQQLNKNASDGAKKVNSRESGSEKTDIPSTNSNGKQEVERPRTSLEDNIVLGVALEGSKRTLPIEDDETTATVTSAESKELAASRNGAGSASVGMEKKDDQIASVPATGQSDQREKER